MSLTPDTAVDELDDDPGCAECGHAGTCRECAESQAAEDYIDALLDGDYD